tara:strand:+ start:1972 stop:3822 length:1851 start_codon:yes stop_codon:yes gene_type:complete
MLLNNKNFFLFCLSILLFLSKWIFSFSFFDENLDVKIIFESVTDGKYYYPLIKYFAELNFNNSYDPAITNLKIIPLPIAGIIFHSLFYKIFGITSFIIIELFCIFFFLLIFKKIFTYFFSENNSIIFALSIFILPSLIILLNLDKLPFISLLENNFYTLRVPRPMVSSLYFFTFIYLMVSMYMSKFYIKKKFIYTGVIFGLTLSSFYYYFFIEVIIFFLLLCLKFKKSLIKEIYKNFYLYALLLLFFIITITPFLINLFLHETDFTSRQCIFELDSNKKFILIKHYLINYLKLEFLALVSILSFLTFLSNKLRIANYKIINIFFIIFISCILAPLLFVSLSNKSCVLYHFNNLIIVWAVIFLFVLSIVYFQNLMKLNINNKLRNLLIIFFISIYSFTSFEKIDDFSKDKNKNLHRKEFHQVTSIISDNLNLSKSNLLTFDNDIMIWSIINNIQYLNLVNGLFISKTDEMIENDLINVFKFLNLNSSDFMNFIQNKKISWRYMNLNVSDFFFYKYQANSLTTFKNSSDFDTDIKFEIAESSPLLQQQSIIPNFELTRLKNKFLNSDFNFFNEPNIIILNKEKEIFSQIKIDKKKYCNLFNGQKLVLYVSKNQINNCN